MEQIEVAYPFSLTMTDKEFDAVVCRVIRIKSIYLIVNSLNTHVDTYNNSLQVLSVQRHPLVLCVMSLIAKKNATFSSRQCCCVSGTVHPVYCCARSSLVSFCSSIVFSTPYSTSCQGIATSTSTRKVHYLTSYMMMITYSSGFRAIF